MNNELLVWMLGFIGAFLSFCAHLLLSIQSKLSVHERKFEVFKTRVFAEIYSIRRHSNNNRLEQETMEDYLKRQESRG